jgi:hypothetical protein
LRLQAIDNQAHGRLGVIRDRRLAGHPHSTSEFARKPTFFSSQSDYRSLHCDVTHAAEQKADINCNASKESFSRPPLSLK